MLQHEFFEKTVKNFPERIALDNNGTLSSYKKINSLANFIAKNLINLGCEANDRICIITEKNIFMYSAILGVLKSGSCWVPLSTSWPEERLLWLLKELNPKLIILDEKNSKIIIDLINKNNLDIKSITLHDDFILYESKKLIFENIIENPKPNFKIKPSSMAYIIFTSGSTGNPKGVVVTHENTSRFLYNCSKIFDIKEFSRFAHFSELHFDPSIFDIFYCWIRAGTLVPLNKRKYKINPILFFNEKKINILFTVPSFIKKILDSEDDNFQGIKFVSNILLTGEEIETDFICKLQKKYPEIILHNMYGTTETAIISHHGIIPKILPQDRKVPLGKPLPGLEVLLMDGDQVVKNGEIGEHIVSGEQISKTYWNNKEENNKHFFINPKNNKLSYKTGDLLLLDNQDNYFYYGRSDDQVKIRGHRVELSEVETVLKNIDNVIDAAAFPIKFNNEFDILCSFIVANHANINSIKDILSKKLPTYMIPTYIKLTDKILLNQNGKKDYKTMRDEMKKIIEEEPFE